MNIEGLRVLTQNYKRYDRLSDFTRYLFQHSNPMPFILLREYHYLCDSMRSGAAVDEVLRTGSIASLQHCDPKVESAAREFIARSILTADELDDPIGLDLRKLFGNPEASNRVYKPFSTERKLTVYTVRWTVYDVDSGIPVPRWYKHDNVSYTTKVQMIATRFPAYARRDSTIAGVCRFVKGLNPKWVKFDPLELE